MAEKDHASDKQSKRINPFSCAGNILGDFVLRATKWLLSLLLLVQLAMVCLLLYNGNIPVPDFFLRRWREELNTKGIRFESDSIKIDLSGELLIKNAAFYHTDFKEPLVSADLVMVEFSMLKWMIGIFTLNRICISDATVYCPALYSPTGVAEAVYNDGYFDINITSDAFRIDHLQLKTNGLSVALKGMLPKQFAKMNVSRRKLTRTDIATMLHRGCSFFSEWISLRKHLNYFDSPAMVIDLVNDKQLGILAHSRFYCQGLVHPSGLQLGPLSASFDCAFNDGNPVIQGAESSLHADTIRWQNLFYADNIWFVLPNHPIPLNTWRQHLNGLKTYAHNLNFDGLRPEGAYGRLISLKHTILTIEASFHESLNSLNLSAAINLVEKSGILDLESHCDLGKIPRLHDIHPIWQDVRFADSSSIDARLVFGSEFVADTINFTGDFAQIEYKDLRLEPLTLKGSFTGDTLKLEHLQGYLNGCPIAGSYLQNLKTLDYRFILNGNAYPDSLNTIITGSWWREIWDLFQVHTTPPYVSLDVEGNHSEGESNYRLFAYCEFQETSFKGVRLKSLAGYLLGMPELIRLYRVQAENDANAKASLDIAWNLHPEANQTYYTQFSGVSTMPLNDLAQMIGSEDMTFVEDISLSMPPLIKAAGIVYSQISDALDKSIIKVSAEILKPMTYNDIRFDYLNFNAIYQLGLLQLRTINCGLGNGQGTGRLDVTTTESGQDLQIELDLKGARYPDILHCMPFALAEPAVETEASTTAPASIDLSFMAHGPLEDIWQLNGSGQLHIYDADLGRLYLMGAFSRYLYKFAKFNFGALKLDTAKSDFSFHKGRFSFPNLEITGPSARMNAAGVLTLPEKTLAFTIVMAPFSEMEVPLLSQFLLLFSPLTNTLEASLTGTLSEPVYNVNIKPFRAVTGIGKPSKDNN